jgi:predicted metalloprotease with PDZ domain
MRIVSGIAALVSANVAMAERVALKIKVENAGAPNPELTVSLSFAGDMDGETQVALPNEWGGQTQLYLALRDVAAQNATLADGAQPQFKILRHAPGARVTLSYRVVEDANGPPDKQGGNDYRVKLRANLMFLSRKASTCEPRRPCRSKAFPARWRGPLICNLPRRAAC